MSSKVDLDFSDSRLKDVLIHITKHSLRQDHGLQVVEEVAVRDITWRRVGFEVDLDLLIELHVEVSERAF